MASHGPSLRSKITGAFLAPTLLIVMLYGLLTYFASRQGLEDELGKRLVSVAQTHASSMNDGVDAEQLDRIDGEKTRVLSRLRDKALAVQQATDVERVFLFDGEVRAIVDTREGTTFGQPLHAQQADSLEIQTVLGGATASSVLFRGDDGVLYKTGYAPVMLQGKVVAVVGVEASAGYFELLNYVASVLGGLGALGVILILGVGTWVGGQITRPINDLVGEARRLGRGDYQHPIRIAHVDKDELAILADSFEDMRKDILDRDQQLQMMLSGIAHEVRNPLGGMKLFAGLLEEDLAQEGQAEHLDKVAKIQRELAYLDRVVTDFLDFARQQAPDLERFRAAELLTEVDELMATECQACGVRLHIEVEPEDVEITVDRQKVRRAVINCVRNAYQACGEGGRIRVRVTAPDADSRRIEIQDNGPGIPEAQLAEVLTPFFTTKEKGTGLGLSLTRRVAEQHGGTLEIHSALGQGTTVVLVVPFDASLESSNAVPEGWLG